MYDLAITGGMVLDGTGRPSFRADIGIQGDRIAALGFLPRGSAGQEIPAAGLVSCPGFIDTHSHSDLMALADPQLLPKIMQGITTELFGQDGIGAAPLKPETKSAWRQYLSGLNGDPPVAWDWTGMEEYARRLEGVQPATNPVLLVPQGNVRMVVMGVEDLQADESQLQAMEREVLRGMEEGAVGMSLGMIYMPCIFSRREELVRLCRLVGRKGGTLVVHIRSVGDLLLESVEEMISLAQAGGIPVHISHFKASGKRNWPKMRFALEALERAKGRGIEITFDIYPYTAGSTMFLAILPPWALEGGISRTLQRLEDREVRQKLKDQFFNPPPRRPDEPGWDNPVNLVGWKNILVSSVGGAANQRWVGKDIETIAGEEGKDPAETAFQVLLEEEGRVGMIMFLMDEENVAMGLRHPQGMFCTDGLLGGKPHPRVYGTFPRILGRYVRERKDLTLEEAVRKMTSFPAQRFGLRDRGLISEGRAADIVVFDPETVIDRATYEDPRQFPEGVRHVIVNGVHSVAEGRFTGKRGGRVLRKGGDDKKESKA
jgi:N-acyl-D-amino-acid deacylase